MNKNLHGVQRAAWLCLVLALLVGLQPFAPVSAQEGTTGKPPDFQTPPTPEPVTAFQDGTGGTPSPIHGANPGVLNLRPGGQHESSLSPNGLAPAACQDYVQNGDFENNTVWMTYNGANNAGYVHDAAYSGSSSVYLSTTNLPDTSGNYNVYLWQTITIPAQINTLTLSFAAAAQMDPGEHFYVAFYSTTGQLLDYTELTFTSYNWAMFTFLIDPQAWVNQNILLTFEIDTESPPDSYYSRAYLDAVSLVGCGAAGATVSIQGSVRQSGNAGAAAGARVILAHYNASGQVVDSWGVLTNSAGMYTVQGLPVLPPDEYYQPWFLDEENDGRLYYWAGEAIASISPGTTYTAFPFDIANVRLASPSNNSEVGLPATFSWTPRGVAGDVYYLCFYDPQQTNPQSACTDKSTIDAGEFQKLGLQYGKAYGWYVEVVDGSHPYTGKFANAGISYYASMVTFSSSGVNPIPNDDNTYQPPSGWTVMIYFAADNNLSPYKQKYFQDLKQTSGQYPGVNILTLTDFYGPGGTQYCYLKAGAPDCQEWGEQNTADPAVLTRFIQYALEKFPASHTMLVIDNHGHSIYGAAQDETSGGTIMSPDKIYGALQAAGLASRRLDILYYNACLMGSLETAILTRPFANYLVASADTSWGAPVYNAALAPLAGAEKDNPRAAAIRMTNDIARVIQEKGSFASFATYDLAQVDGVNNSLSALADALRANLFTARGKIEDARNQAQKYDSTTDANFALNGEDEFVDLRHLALLLTNSGNAQINNAAITVLNTLGTRQSSALVIASQQISGNNSGSGTPHQYTADAIGLSIYFPNDQLNTQQHNGMVNFYLNSATFNVYKNGTHWDEFLMDYLPPARANLSQSTGVLLQAPDLVTGGLTVLYIPVTSK